MHGLINRTIQSFVSDTYGVSCWRGIAQQADLGFSDFEAMLQYEAAMTEQVLAAAVKVLSKPREVILEDIGTYLVSHPNTEALRRLMRFGGVDFIEFLHSLDDLPDRARLAVPDLDLPALELRDFSSNRFALICSGSVDGFGHVLVGVLRAMADDYGALVILEHEGKALEGGDLIMIHVIQTAYAKGRTFDLGAVPSERRAVLP